MTLLINQLDEHNESGIIYLIKNKVEEVLFLYDTEQEDLMKSIKEYYSSNFSNIKLYEERITEGNIDEFKEIFEKYKRDDMIINLTGGKRINSLILLNLCKENKIKCFYTDIRKKLMYSFNEQLLKTKEEIEDLNLLSIIKGFGGNIVEDSYELCLKDDLIYFSKQIYNNLDLWNKHKQRLYDNSIFLHEENNPEIIHIDYSRIEDEEKKLLDLILNKMKEMNEIVFSKNNDKVKVRFLNNYIKGFIFKSGTWLEIATNNLLKNIKEIDECRNGVIFLWNNGRKTVRNELDVIAVKDSVPICISCKDSDKYNEMALNELNVYANKIGGKNAYKILVATKEPIKEPVKMRAKEMGIHLVIFDGNEEKFINKIRKIIINDELSK